jgi:hypothetical protein
MASILVAFFILVDRFYGKLLSCLFSIFLTFCRV